jgi:hypothetical protein
MTRQLKPTLSALEHDYFGAERHPAIQVDDVLVHHANASDETALPMLSGSVVPWMR